MVYHMVIVIDESGSPYRAPLWSQFPVYSTLWPGLGNSPLSTLGLLDCQPM
jgi:hypothetical protein